MRKQPNLRQYHGLHSGTPAVIYCCGPSLNDYTPGSLKLDNQINIVMKMAILASNKYNKPDYYFFGDRNGRSIPYEHLIKDLNCPKFGLIYIDDALTPKTYDDKFCDAVNAEKCHLSYETAYNGEGRGFHADISKHWFYRCSTVFPCLQFALYSGCNPIYVVGMDLTQADSFQNPKEQRSKIFYGKMSGNLERFMAFKNEEYPGVQVIRVNPVYAKGVFDKDLYV